MKMALPYGALTSSESTVLDVTFTEASNSQYDNMIWEQSQQPVYLKIRIDL